MQIKGRGTRKHDFTEQLLDKELKAQIGKQEKCRYKIFDFFANCEYFEGKFDYDEALKLPRPGEEGSDGPVPPPPLDLYTYTGADTVKLFAEQVVGAQGMKIDRMFFEPIFLCCRLKSPSIRPLRGLLRANGLSPFW